MRNARPAHLLLLLALTALPALAVDGQRHGTDADATGEDVAAAQDTAAAEGDDADAVAEEERRARLHGTGSRAGFRHDTRPTGKLAGKGRQRVVERQEGEVAPRPTRWDDETVGGKTVHQVRFRREGEPGDGDDEHP